MPFPPTPKFWVVNWNLHKDVSLLNVNKIGCGTASTIFAKRSSYPCHGSASEPLLLARGFRELRGVGFGACQINLTWTKSRQLSSGRWANHQWHQSICSKSLEVMVHTYNFALSPICCVWHGDKPFAVRAFLARGIPCGPRTSPEPLLFGDGSHRSPGISITMSKVHLPSRAPRCAALTTSNTIFAKVGVGGTTTSGPLEVAAMPAVHLSILTVCSGSAAKRRNAEIIFRSSLGPSLALRVFKPCGRKTCNIAPSATIRKLFRPRTTSFGFVQEILCMSQDFAYWDRLLSPLTAWALCNIDWLGQRTL